MVVWASATIKVWTERDPESDIEDLTQGRLEIYTVKLGFRLALQGITVVKDKFYALFCKEP